LVVADPRLIIRVELEMRNLEDLILAAIPASFLCLILILFNLT